jgi:phosphoribosylformimino-5-aminoimidazole carboxamide ribotide isomerase
VLHVVDLDGAATGTSHNLDALRTIRAATTGIVQYGGGLRSDEAVAAAFEAGADRVVIGTALVSRPDWVAFLVERFGERVMVSIDARRGKVATEGWRSGSGSDIVDIVARANELGVRRALVTDIEKDGMLQGPNLNVLREVVEQAKFPVIASGGITTLADLDLAAAAGAEGAIVGQALYAGRLDLTEAIARMSAAVSER